MEEVICEYEQLLGNLLPKLNDADRNHVMHKVYSR